MNKPNVLNPTIIVMRVDINKATGTDFPYYAIQYYDVDLGQTQSVTLPRSDAYFVLDTLQKATNVYSSLLMQEAVNDTLRTILLRDSACVELSIDILKAILPDTL